MLDNELHTIEYMDAKEGDVTFQWNPKKPEEVETARQLFNDLMSKGHFAYTIEGRNKQGVQIRSFDPTLGKIILAAPLRGG